MATLQEDSQGNEVKELQANLEKLGFYAGQLDSDFGPETKGAVQDFQARYGGLKVDGIVGSNTFNAIQAALVSTPPTPFSFFSKFKKEEDKAKANADKLVFLDRGLDNPESPFKEEIINYPAHLQRKPDGVTLLSHLDKSGKFSPYPPHDEYPSSGIEENGLSFLSLDVQQACVCIGSFDASSNLKARWVGRNALEPVQFWSATKFIPVLNLVCQANRRELSIPIEECTIRGSAETVGTPFAELVTDLVSYREGVDHSNVVAEMFKRFETTPHSNLETWLRRITHNDNLKFQGGYSSSEPFIKKPTLYHPASDKSIVKFQDPGTGSNYLSAYDLVRMISMLGWHNYLPSVGLPNAEWHSLASVVKCMGTDTARYVDVAIKTLGLQSTTGAPVIISKLGFGTTGRGEDALTYTAFVQFIDGNSSPAKLRTLAMALRIPTTAAAAPKHDAKMASEVTEIIRRIVTEELA